MIDWLNSLGENINIDSAPEEDSAEQGFVEIFRCTKKKRLVAKKESFFKNSRSEKIAKSWDVVFWMSPLSNLASWSSHSSLTIVQCFITHSRSSMPTITLKSAGAIVIDTLLFGGNLFGKNGSFSTSLFVSFSRIQLAFGSSPVYPPEVEHSSWKVIFSIGNESSKHHFSRASVYTSRLNRHARHRHHVLAWRYHDLQNLLQSRAFF